MRITLLCVALLAACHSSTKAGSLAFTQPCSADADCVSGRCLEAPDTSRFCSQACGTDTDCTSQDTAYCCEALTDSSYCVKPALGQCLQPTLGDGCAFANDPYCSRAQGMSCQAVGGEQVCTIACTTDADCTATTQLLTCQTVGSQQLCVPTDPASLPRQVSNCHGDRDCTGTDVCQVEFDNNTDPEAIVFICSSTQLYGTQKAFTSCTADRTQCDRFFCVNGLCPSTCTNDSHCPPGFVCTPEEQQFPSGTSVFGLCTKQLGSGLPCDMPAAACNSSPCAPDTCPAGEACSYRRRYDGAFVPQCQTSPVIVQPTQPVSTTFSHLGQQCSTQVQDPTTGNVSFQLVSGKVQLCDDNLCLGTGYCSSPCLQDSDCSGSAGMSCVYQSFAPHCEPNDGQVGTADGGACSGTGLTATTDADAECASSYCDATVGTCGTRKPVGTACSRDDECASLACPFFTCVQPCRDDSVCATGTACQALPVQVSVPGASTPLIDTQTFCIAVSGFTGGSGSTACPQSSCSGAGQACLPLVTRAGGFRGVCADKVGSGAIGSVCVRDADCASGLCFTFDNGASACSSVCIDDTDCGSGLHCMPQSALDTHLDLMCAASSGSTANGAACAQDSDCTSNLCINQLCEPICGRGSGPGSTCSGGFCALVGVSIDPRGTKETFDDLYGSTLACVPGATPFLGDPTACSGAKQFVFWPTSVTGPSGSSGPWQGACLQPISDGLAAGSVCRSATECQSGLCVDNLCTTPCTQTPQDSCTGTNKCDLIAPAVVGEVAALTAPITACRQPCVVSGPACPSGAMCDAGTHFCR